MLFAIVVGGAITVQQVVKSKLQGSVKKYADEYSTAAGNASSFEPARTTTSNATTTLNMTGANAGNVTIGSTSNTSQTK